MSRTDRPAPGPAAGASVEKDGESWTLVLVRQLGHAPERVWRALTEPQELSRWSPFDSDGSLGQAGSRVRLTTVGAGLVSDTIVVRADRPRVLQFNWGDRELRWELEALAGGTRLTLWNNIDRKFIAMGAAGWHLCLEGLGFWLDGAPFGRLVGPEALQDPGWRRLFDEYSKMFGMPLPKSFQEEK